MKTSFPRVPLTVSLAGLLVVVALSNATVLLAQTPDTFTWSGGASGIWNAPGGWTPQDTSRDFPEIAGDQVVTTNGVTLTLNGDTTVSRVSASGGSLAVSSDGVVTQTFESASAAVTNRIYSLKQNVYLGDGVADDDLVLNVVDNLLISGNRNDGIISTFVRGKIVGGTAESPIALLTEVNNSEWGSYRVFLMNANNSFRGDVYIGSAGMGSKGNLFVFLGNGSTPGVDSMLGHPDNKIILRNQKPNFCVTQGSAEGLKRRVIGSGNVRGLRIDQGWPSITHPSPVILGDGSSLEPSVEFSNPIGKINIIGSTITTHTNSQIRINVTPTAKDVVAFNGTSAFTYAGKVLMEPLEPVAPGTSWDIITVTAATKAFTFSPSCTTPLYSFKTTGNATDGWVVTATRQVDTTLFPAVQNLEATLIAETNATVNADVISVAPDGEATLRAYFGTVDQGADFGAWEQVATHPAAVTGPEACSLKLNTLQLNETYYVRHSISNSTGESMSLDVTSFTTRPWETPDIFTWAATNENWQTLGAWTIDTPYERRIPGFKGDQVVVNVGGSWPNSGIARTLNITNDVVIGEMRVNDGYGSQVAVTATNGPATLTFDSDGTGASQISSVGQLSGLYFGNAEGDPGLTLELKKPLLFSRNSAWGLDAQFHARIVGGSEEAPAGIHFNSQGDQYCKLNPSLLDTNNTFRGDVHLGDSQTRGSSTMLTIGSNAKPARNERLGDAANQVFLRNNSTLRYHCGAEASATVERHVKGTGKLTSTAALHLGANAVLDPLHISGSGHGTITVEAGAVTTDADAQYVLDLKASGEANDKLVFRTTSPLTLTGSLELVAESGERVAVGTSWDVITVPKEATAFTCAVAKTPGYVLKTTGDETTGWTVAATAISSSTVVIVR
ncbi:MAG: hypothetical protein ACOX9C_02090 [Kiritimatiellia bacterium]